MIELLLGIAISVCIHTKTTIVTKLDYTNDVVTVIDSDKEEYRFYGCEDWYKGDICKLIFLGNKLVRTIYKTHI